MPRTTTIRMRATAFLFLATFAFSLAPTSSAHAAGFYLFDRGVQAMGRGGAFVAGAQGVYSLWYNPAGLRFGGRELLGSLALARLSAGTEFTRTDSSGTLPKVGAQQEFIPIPSLGYADNFGLRKWSFGIMLDAPSAIIQKWPTSVDVGGVAAPAPQRYSLYSANTTFFAEGYLGAAYEPIRGLSFGASLGVHLAQFAVSNAVSACDGGLICMDPQSPAFDSVVKVKSHILAAPLAILGVTYRHPRWFSVGASFVAPWKFQGNGSLHVQLPPAPIFAGSTVVDANGGPPTISASVNLPWIVRGGIEVRPVENLRVETAVVVEGWSRQQNITFTPNDVVVTGGVVGALPPQYNTIIPINVPRHMKNTVSIRVGGEYTYKWLDVRLGVAYETGAFNNPYLTPLTLDSNKTTVSGGISVRTWRTLSLDAAFAWTFMQSHTVTDSQVKQPVAILPGVPGAVPIGNGNYQMGGYYVGVGLRWRPDPRRPRHAEAQPAATPSQPTQPLAPTTSTISPAHPAPYRVYPSTSTGQ